MSGIIPRHERAPETEEEWKEALKLYVVAV
jgi:hypothetical protein